LDDEHHPPLQQKPELQAREEIMGEKIKPRHSLTPKQG